MNPSYRMLILWNTIKHSKYVVVVIIYLAFLLDNMLLTVVVPIIPDILHSSSLKLIPKSAFYDNIENLLPNIKDLNGAELINSTYKPLLIENMNQRNMHQPTYDDDEEIERENGPVGVLLASKALVQLVFNPIVGLWTAKAGYKVPIFSGSIVILIASLMFAYGESFLAMLLARSLQGVGSACIGVSGMCLAAETFRDEKTRSKIMAILLGGSALGVLIGYPFGGFLYEFVDKTAPFLVIALLAFLTIMLQLTFLDLRSSAETIERHETIWWPLLMDNVVRVATGAIFISTSAMAILEPILPIWLMTHLKPEKWQLGIVFIPDSVGYLIGTNFFGTIVSLFGPWRLSAVALIITGISAFMIPSAITIWGLTLPHFGLGLGIGALDAAIVPQLAVLVDKRHAAQYGAVFSLQQTAVSFAYSIAPLIGGALARSVGFAHTLRGLGLLNILYSIIIAMVTLKLDNDIQSTRLYDSQSSDCESLNHAISMTTYGTPFE